MILFLASAAPASAAGVCRALRPNWTPDIGPVGPIYEALNLLLAPWPLLTMAMIATAWFVRKSILGHIALALAISLVAVLVIVPFLTIGTHMAEARVEGCVGPSYLRTIAAGLILAGAALVVIRNWRADMQAGE